MSTKAQTKANRKNAQKSTGPRTAEGKAVVSKNAVKHGLFAAEAVITGEDPAEYEAYHDQFLAEMVPVGAVETMLVERFVSLTWRLRRAERMQNQAIEEFIETEITNPLPRRTRVLTLHAQGIPLGDKRCTSSHLPLGRIATSDWSCCRVLDRMLLYERRIENSTLRMLREFKKQQIMRRIEQQDISYDQAVVGVEAFTGKKVDLKKQTQFVPGSMGATPYMKGDYDNMPACGIEENKANSKPNKAELSQFQTPAADKPGESAEFDCNYAKQNKRKVS